MLIAYNNDIEYKERWYHIQTEDNGIKDGHITTTVFHSGQILDPKTTSYREAIAGASGEDQINAIIKDMMIKQHQMFYGRLQEGMYDAQMQNFGQSHTSAISASQSGAQPVPVSTTAKAVVIAPSMTVGNASARLESNTLSGSNKKPDILRASQQVSNISKAGIHSINTLNQKPDVEQSAASPKFAPQPVMAKPSVTITAPRIVTSISVPRSKAVENERMNAKNHAWKGISWPDDDLAIDMLVVSML